MTRDDGDSAELPVPTSDGPDAADDPAYLAKVETWAAREAEKESLFSFPWVIACAAMLHGALIGPLFGEVWVAVDRLEADGGLKVWHGAVLGLLIGPILLSFVAALALPGLAIQLTSGKRPTLRQRFSWAAAPVQVLSCLLMIGPKCLFTIPRRYAQGRFVERYKPLGVDFGRDGFGHFCGINFRCGPFGDEDLFGLKMFVDLDHLDLSGTRITDAILPVVGKLRRIELLVLERTAITDAGVGFLCKLQRLSSLQLGATDQ